MVQLILILDNLRSAHNVGAILRTADAAGVTNVFCAGTTPYPRLQNDQRDPVISNRNTRSIAKTALGAETTIPLEYFEDTISAITAARAKKCTVIGLERTPEALNLLTLPAPPNVALVVGNEVSGLDADVQAACNIVAQLPQRGTKESLNVASATAIALYHLAFSQ